MKSFFGLELEVQELAGESRADDAAEDDFCRFRTRVEGNRENGGHEVSTEHCCIVYVGLAR